jgi:hypothetical protein
LAFAFFAKAQERVIASNDFSADITVLHPAMLAAFRKIYQVAAI